MFHFGNYNNLKCGRGGFGVWACPLKASLVKHCTSKAAQRRELACNQEFLLYVSSSSARPKIQTGTRAKQEIVGPPTQLTGQMRHAIAKSMMAKKKAKIRALLRSFALRVAASDKFECSSHPLVLRDFFASCLQHLLQRLAPCVRQDIYFMG